ncbi:MAG: hypothetical protein ABI866_05640 [Dokdonella sp.]
MNCRLRSVAAVLCLLAAPHAFAADAVDAVDASITVPGLSPPLPTSQLSHGFAALDAGDAEQGTFQLKLMLTNQPVTDKLAEPAGDPNIAFMQWRMQNQAGAAKSLVWADFDIDASGNATGAVLGRGFSGSLGLYDTDVIVRLTRVDGERVAGTFAITSNSAQGQGTFDVPWLDVVGGETSLKQHLAAYPELSKAAEQGARETYATYVQALREDRSYDVSHLASHYLETGPTGPDSAASSPWPVTVYAARVQLDSDREGVLDADAAKVVLAACERGAPGEPNRAVVTLRRSGAERQWMIESSSNEGDELAGFGPLPASCAAAKG